MKSKIAEALKLKYEPVAIIWSDRKPDDAVQFKEGAWGCVMWMLARAAKGKVAVFDRNTFGCPGGGTGLGFGNYYVNFIGGFEGFCYFLSTGFESWDRGKQLVDVIRNYVRDERMVNKIVHGERYIKSPELVKKFVEQLPITSIPNQYVIFKPLSEVRGEDEPVVIVFVVNPHQLSALITLANYSREGVNNVIVPMGAGCQQIGIYAYREAQSDEPRAVVGLTDPDSRLNVRKQLGDEIFTFTVPFRMFEEMEREVDESFLRAEVWSELSEYYG